MLLKTSTDPIWATKPLLYCCQKIWNKVRTWFVARAIFKFLDESNRGSTFFNQHHSVSGKPSLYWYNLKSRWAHLTPTTVLFNSCCTTDKYRARQVGLPMLQLLCYRALRKLSARKTALSPACCNSFVEYWRNDRKFTTEKGMGEVSLCSWATTWNVNALDPPAMMADRVDDGSRKETSEECQISCRQKYAHFVGIITQRIKMVAWFSCRSNVWRQPLGLDLPIDKIGWNSRE